MNQIQQKKLEQLTPEQESLIPIINDKWINLALDGKTELKYSQELQDGINWIYQKANQKNTNPLIIIAPSPYSAQLIANFINNASASYLQNPKPCKVIKNPGTYAYVGFNTWGYASDGKKFRNYIEHEEKFWRDDVFTNVTFDTIDFIKDRVAVSILTDIADNKIQVAPWYVSESVARIICDKVHKDVSSPRDPISSLTSVVDLITNISKNVISETRFSTSNYIRNLIAKGVSASINNVTIPIEVSVLSSVGCDIGDSIEFDRFEYFIECDCFDLCGRIAYLDYFDEIGVLKNEEFRKLRDTLSLGIWSAIFFENVAILSMTPSKVLLDDNKRLHSVSGPAVKFRDGYSTYQIHGVSFDENTFHDVTQRKIPVKGILSLSNIEQRYVALEYYGFENIIDELNARLIDESPRGNKLYEIGFAIGVRRIVITKFLKYSCPSTERNYGSFVKPEITRADQAMAWKHNCTEQEYEVLKLEA